MKKFAIYALGENGNYSFKAEKTGKNETPPKTLAGGYVFVTILTSGTAKGAASRAELMSKNGALELPEKEIALSATIPKVDANGDKLEVKKAIYCDINGVLDDFQKNLDCREFDASFRLPKIIDPEKLFMVAKLALKHNAELVITSEWRKQGISFRSLIRILRQSENPEHKAFFEDNKQELRYITMESTDVRRDQKRTLEIIDHARANKVTHMVVLEDDHPIDAELNPIMTQGSIGLKPEHIERADQILSAA